MRYLLLLVLAGSIAGCKTTPDSSVASVGISFKSTGRKSKRAATRNDCYEDHARAVLVRTGALREKHKQFARIDPEDLKWQEPVVTNEKLWIAFRYESAVDFGPEREEAPELHPIPKGFLSPEGISLRMYFFTGPWTGAAEVPQKAIGEMKVAYFLDVPDAATGKILQSEIDRILDEAATQYDGRCSGKRPPPAKGR